MGEAKRRREDLGDLYGTPQGSNTGDRLAQHVQHLAKGAKDENDAARDTFRVNIGRYLTPEDQFVVWNLLEEPEVDRLQIWTFQPAPGADPDIAAVELCREGVRVWLQRVHIDPSRPAQRRDQEALDREDLECIRLHLADGDRVVLFGTAAARPLVQAAGIPWLHELPETEPLPLAIACDLEIGPDKGGRPLPAGYDFVNAVLFLGAGSGPWVKALVGKFGGGWKPFPAPSPAPSTPAQ